MLLTTEQRLAPRMRPDQTALILQNWRDLLFLHWAFEPQAIQKLLPKGLFVDTYEAKAYIGIVPFSMQEIKPYLLQMAPGLSFCELNLRTYVYDERGIPGVWFFSLDANSWLSVQLAKIAFYLPYIYSSFQYYKDLHTDAIEMSCQRPGKKSTTYSYQALEPISTVSVDSLEFFLVERYVLFSKSPQGQLYEARIHHAPYALRKVDVKKWDAQLFEWDGIEPPLKEPDHIIFSKGVDVETFKLTRIS